MACMDSEIGSAIEGRVYGMGDVEIDCCIDIVCMYCTYLHTLQVSRVFRFLHEGKGTNLHRKSILKISSSSGVYKICDHLLLAMI